MDLDGGHGESASIRRQREELIWTMVKIISKERERIDQERLSVFIRPLEGGEQEEKRASESGIMASSAAIELLVVKMISRSEAPNRPRKCEGVWLDRKQQTSSRIGVASCRALKFGQFTERIVH